MKPPTFHRVLSLVAALLSVAGTTPLASAQIPWSNFAGNNGGSGNADGPGSAARFYYPGGVAVDGNGNVYVADAYNHTIRKMAADGVVTTLAGSAGVSGSADGTGSAARFNHPFAVAVDGSGNLYVADTNNSTIRKVTAAGVVTTLAGSAGAIGSADGTGGGAEFYYPAGVAVDGNGNVYVADTGNNTIRKVTADAVVTTLAGSAGGGGSIDGVGFAAQFLHPCGVAADASGNVYVADTQNNTIRKVTADGVVTTVAGRARVSGSTDATGSAARFYNPTDVAVDGDGNVYVADGSNHAIRKMTAGGVVTTLAGSADNPGSADGPGNRAEFDGPAGVAVDASGNVYVGDSGNNEIRKVTAEGIVTTLAGRVGAYGSADGTGGAALFSIPVGVAADRSGNVYVADFFNQTIRKITADGVVTTLAGSAGVSGSADGTGSAARFYNPTDVAVDGSGNVYVADNHTIRKVTGNGVVTTLAGSPGAYGSADGTGSAARFHSPFGVAVDESGNVYVADNQTIRKVTADGVVTTLAGSAGVFGAADGTGSAARFYNPSGVAVDGSGNLYVADSGNSTIREVTADGVVTTIGGMPGALGGGEGLGTSAAFDSPERVAFGTSGKLFVANTGTDSIAQGILPAAPAISAPTVAGVTDSSVTLGGNVTSDGAATVTERGIVYSRTADDSDPTLSTGTNVTTSGTTGVFTVNVSGLSAATTYSFKAYATSSIGTSYTELATFMTVGTPTPTPKVEFTAANYRVEENQRVVTVTLKRTGDQSKPATVHVATSNGSARAGSDYIAESSDQTIPAGATTKEFQVRIINDRAAEQSKTFTVRLTPSASADLGAQSTATVTIIDKDRPTVEFASAAYKVKERNKPATLTIKRIGKQSTKVRVHYQTGDGTAKAGADYRARSGDVLFPATGGDTATITIPIINNQKREPDKTFTVTLTGTPTAFVGAPKTATVTIVDLD